MAHATVEPCGSLEAAVEHILARVPGALRVGAPLGLGKPHRLLNALYGRVAGDPARALHLYTALSLDPPDPAEGLAARLLGPFVRRHFGDEFPRLAHVEAERRDALPDHVTVEEFYLQSGALLGSSQAQRRHANLNYTHVVRALVDRRVNCIVQRVAARAGDERLSLSSNTDITLDAVAAIVAAGLPRPLMVAEVDPELPWLGGGAAVPPGYFDVVVRPPGPHPRLFAPPRRPVSDVDHAIGLYASALVRDGGTLQIGIGTLSDALCHALALRQRDNPRYRRVLRALHPGIEDLPAVVEAGGLAPLTEGLYGCSEMITDGFMKLVEVGVLRRKVLDDEATMRRLADGSADADDRAALERDGQCLHAAFYLGSPDFYAWLRGLDEPTRRALDMRGVLEVNQLPPGREALARLQRRHARFFNTCMVATTLGGAASDTLEDGREVSGVGGQYNFVAMAHALADARSVLMLRSTRGDGDDVTSCVREGHAHLTIPRHLRDVYVSEYGIADVRGRTDEDCVAAMVGLADARFAPDLLAHAHRAGKLAAGAASRVAEGNTPARLRAALRPFRADGTLPDYPLGSDFTAVEQRLVRALAWLRGRTASGPGKLRTLAAALVRRGPTDDEALRRMDLADPRSPGERVQARLLALALRETAS